jgi:hypothetical protein
LLNLVLAPLTLGFTLLVLAGMYFLATPRRVWLKGGRLFSDSLPPQGVEIVRVRLELGCQTLVGVTVNRWLRIYYWEWDQEHYFNLNQMYVGGEAIDRIMAALS